MASVLARRKLIVAPNPLAYPAGVKAGFDPAHVAAKNPRLAAVTSGGLMVDLLTGKPGTKVGSPTFKMDGGLGPSLDITGSSSTDGLTFSGKPAVTDNKITLAAILSFDSNTSNPQFVITNSGTENVGFYNNGSGSLYARISGSSFPTGLSVNTNIPVFIALSYCVVGSDTLINVVQSYFTLGTVFQTTITATGSVPSASDGTYMVGNWVEATPVNARVAAAMGSATFLSPAQLLAWANDPWSFWYPNKTINLTSTAASVGATFLPVWAVGYNLPVIGTGIY